MSPHSSSLPLLDLSFVLRLVKLGSHHLLGRKKRSLFYPLGLISEGRELSLLCSSFIPFPLLGARSLDSDKLFKALSLSCFGKARLDRTP